MELKLGNTAGLVAELVEAATSGGDLSAGRWIDGRIVGVLASPELQSARHLAVGVSALPAGVSAPQHSHEAEEIAIVLDGLGRIVIGEEPIEVRAGDVVRTPPEVPHTTTAGPEGTLSILWVYAPAGSENRWLRAEQPVEEPA